MSMNDPSTNPQWPQQPPPKTGMKGSTKVLIGLAIAFGVLCVLCCGVFGGVAYYFKRGAARIPNRSGKSPNPWSRWTFQMASNRPCRST